jgi:tripartite-type tricarboxylate transporter receptor subunit TctC
MNKIIKAALIGWLLSCSAAMAYPDRPVRLIVPFAPGGVTDLAARIVGQHLTAKWGQQVVIENKPGAGGIIGVETAINATPDGYTLLMATSGEISIIPAISVKQLRYDSQKDLIPIALVSETPFVWVVNVNSGITSLADLVARAKAKPGDLAYSSAGNGSSNHMATEQFTAAAGIKLLHVPYRGGNPASAAVTAGEVPIGTAALSSILPFVGSDKVKMLGVTSLKRSKLIPDVPTVTETGVLKDFEATIWAAMFAPKGTPPAIVAKVQADVIEVLKDPALIARFEAAGASAVGTPGDALSKRIASELEMFGKIAKDANIRLE